MKEWKDWMERIKDERGWILTVSEMLRNLSQEAVEYNADCGPFGRALNDLRYQAKVYLNECEVSLARAENKMSGN